jgi:hypothetical protein
MTVNLSMFAGAGAQFFDNNGGILSGGLVYTYAAGTTTPQATYTTSAGNVAHTNPIVLNSAGRVASGGEIWLTDAVAYKFVLETSAAVTIATYDNVTGNSSGISSALAAPSGSSLVGYLAAPNNAVATTVQAKLRQTVSVKDFGAVGDGVTNDTAAFQAAFNYIASVGRVSLYLPSGDYRINGTITINSALTSLYLDCYGNGQSTRIIQYAAASTFYFTNNTQFVSFRDFQVSSAAQDFTIGNAVFAFPNGNSLSYFSNIFYSELNNAAALIGAGFYYCAPDKINDAVYFYANNVVVNRVGYNIGAGSSIFINGGRVIGNYPTTGLAVGINITGGNGGVYIYAVDTIALATGIDINQTSGTTNREIFISQSSADSCNIGINIVDNSYVSIIGLWAASCRDYNVVYNPPSFDPNGILNISGGTIFNAGAIAGGVGVGLAIGQYGYIGVSNVVFRYNVGRGISCTSGARAQPAIFDSCFFYANGTAQAYLAGAIYFRNNSFVQNGVVPNVTIDESNQVNMRIHDNEGYQGSGLRATNIALGASNVDVTNTFGQTLEIYLRGGTVTIVFAFGNPIYDYGAGGPANCFFKVRPGETFKVIYTVAPTLVSYYA